jgi:predicted MPP superfamily phosphohydrolase
MTIVNPRTLAGSMPPPPARRGLTRRGWLTRGLALSAVAGLVMPGTAAFAAAEAANDLIVTDYRPVPPAWPDSHRLTITVIADLHAGGPNMGIERVREVVDAGIALDSDLVVILGDYFATHHFITEHVPPAAWAAELGRLKAPLGVYAILGNHDWWYNVDGVRAALRQVRIPLMENDAVLLGRPGARFWLAGLGDQLAHWLGPSQFRGEDDLPGTLAKVNTDDPVILLAHEPDIFPDVPARVALTLAGHTHGGQIKLPMIPPVWAPSAYGARFAYGHIVERDRHMIVSGGLGTSKVPLRLGVPPEILRITLGA